jgi:hypothetical protein
MMTWTTHWCCWQIRTAFRCDFMAQWQRVGFQTRRLGVRFPLRSFTTFLFCFISCLFSFGASSLRVPLVSVCNSLTIVHVGQASTLTTQMLKNCLTLLSVLVRTSVSTCSLVWVSSHQKKEKGYFHAGIWTRVLWVKTTYPNQLDYAESDVDVSAHSFLPTAVSV